MKYRLSGLIPLIIFSQATSADTVKSVSIAQPTGCILSQFSAIGDQHWKTVSIKLTNNCGQIVDFQNSTITFKSLNSITTSFWGDFSPLSYPDNALNITSQPQQDGNYLAAFNLHFPSYPGANSKLPVGGSFQMHYGVSSDLHMDGTINVYLGTVIESAALTLNNTSPKPANVAQNYALVHVSMNGQMVNTVQLPWTSSVTIPGLATGTYTLAPVNVADSNGNNYQGTAVPSVVTLTANQNVSSNISYAQVQQTGKIAVNLQSLPSELSGYVNNPNVLLTQSQSGNSVSQSLTWGNSTTVNQLKDGGVYTFSTPVVQFNGYNCAPTFNPSALTASAGTAPVTNLTYQCLQNAEDTVTLNVTGAPITLQSLKVNLMPNNNTEVITKTINLVNGSGSDTVQLTDGVIYNVSADAVAGYTAAFSPQPLTATANGIETITLTATNTGTPVAVNGQLTVCGTKLCNEHGQPLQLKGMSTHGLQWYGIGNCVTPTALNALSNDFKSNVVRVALYVQEGGYETNPAKFTNDVSNLINEAYDRGIYIIVDWHILNPGDPNYNLTRARQFFTEIATIHKNKNNIIYEIANEPNGVSWSTIRNYANQIIPVIRAIDSKAPIIVGTRGWSSLGLAEGGSFQEIVNNPVPFSNIMYAFHFYAASHQDFYLNELDRASQVLPVFVSEFGTQTFTGDGANDFLMSDRYIQLMATKGIGWTNWNFSDDFRSGAIWKTNTCSSGAWIDSNLKPAGVYIKGKIKAA